MILINIAPLAPSLFCDNMPPWKFNCFLSESEEDVIDDWYKNDLPPKARAKFDTILEHFRDKPNNQWGAKYFKPLTGYDGIFEIRFNVNNVLYRPLGFFGPRQSEFTLLIGAREQGDEFIPRNAPQTAQERKNIVVINNRRCHECDFEA